MTKEQRLVGSMIGGIILKECLKRGMQFESIQFFERWKEEHILIEPTNHASLKFVAHYEGGQRTILTDIKIKEIHDAVEQLLLGNDGNVQLRKDWIAKYGEEQGNRMMDSLLNYEENERVKEQKQIGLN